MKKKKKELLSFFSLSMGNLSVCACINPKYVVMYRLQAQPMNSQNRYTGMIYVFRRTYREEGLLAFYKGLFPNLLKVIPAASITYMAYEEMKSQLGL